MKAQGMTLVELLVTLTVTAMLLVIGVPAFMTYLNDAKIRAAAESITAGMNRARSEAIMRNTQIQFTPVGSGWRIVQPAAGGNPATTIAMSESAQFANNVIATPSAATVTFNGSGRTTGAGLYTVGLASPTVGTCAVVGGGVHCLQVEVTATGSVKICDPAVPASDPRAC